MISKKFTFLNVGNQASFLGNIKTAVDVANSGAEYGWTIDRYSSGDDGELLLHSNGFYGNQNLFYSLKLRVPSGGCSHLQICGQTGYDSGAAYDAQPGKFSVNQNGLCPAWDGNSQGSSNYGNYVKSPIAKMCVFVNKQNIFVWWKDEISLWSLPGTTYPIWRHFTIGAMDSFTPTTETFLNWIDESIAQRCGWASSPFIGQWKYKSHHDGYGNWYRNPQPSTGFLWKQPYDSTPINYEPFTSSSDPYRNTYNIRLYSTISFYDNATLHSGSGTVQNPYYYSSFDISSLRFGGDYSETTRYNISVVKHVLHRPIFYLYHYINSEQVYVHPLCYAPYQAVRMANQLKGDDVISYGTRNFSVYPTFREGNTFGVAIEFIEG